MAKAASQKQKPKTRKAILERFKFSNSGKVLRKPVGQNHFLAKQTSKQRRKLRKWVEVSAPEAKKLKKLIRE